MSLVGQYGERGYSVSFVARLICVALLLERNTLPWGFVVTGRCFLVMFVNRLPMLKALLGSDHREAGGLLRTASSPRSKRRRVAPSPELQWSALGDSRSSPGAGKGDHYQGRAPCSKYEMDSPRESVVVINSDAGAYGNTWTNGGVSVLGYPSSHLTNYAAHA